MKTEMNIVISITENEKNMLVAANDVLKKVLNELDDFKENGFLPYIDNIELPDEIMEAVIMCERIEKLKSFDY